MANRVLFALRYITSDRTQFSLMFLLKKTRSNPDILWLKPSEEIDLTPLPPPSGQKADKTQLKAVDQNLHLCGETLTSEQKLPTVPLPRDPFKINRVLTRDIGFCSKIPDNLVSLIGPFEAVFTPIPDLSQIKSYKGRKHESVDKHSLHSTQGIKFFLHFFFFSAL